MSYTRYARLTLAGILALFIMLTLGKTERSFAAARTVDGNPTDWTGTPSPTPHTDAESGDEWLYTGVSGDRRTDSGMTDDNDITEIRLTTDGTYLYMLFRMVNISNQNDVHIAIGFDTDQDNTDAAQNFLGDDSGVTFASRAFIRPERQLALHVAGSGNPEIEWIDAGGWYGIGGSQIAISTANDIVEARVPLADLNGLTANSDFGLTVATFNNNAGWNNVVDATATGAVDVAGIPGQSGNAWDRDLNDGNIFFGWWVQLRGSSNAPTAVVWERLYHSACDQPLSTGCTNGDHPAIEKIPSENNNPGQEDPTFLSTRRYGGQIPGHATDVYVYDDETSVIYFLSTATDLTDTALSPRILYFPGGVNVDMDLDYTWTGSWHNSPELEYAVYSGTIPSQAVGDVYYTIVTEDETGERSLCRTSGGSGNNNKGLNLMGQWVGASGCSNNDYAYSILDDDSSGPAISNFVPYTGSQVCADIVENTSDSGDNNSGLFQILLRHDASFATVNSGGGTTTPMTLTGGNTYCATVTFSDPTYYRVEATNNDFDNSAAADRDTSLTSIFCTGASCATPGTDNNVRWYEVLHDSRNRTTTIGGAPYRSPFGAVPASSQVTLRIRTAENDLTAATLRIYAGSTTDYSMSKMSGDINPTYDWYEATFTVPATPQTIAYKFILTDGTDSDWYIDDYAHNSYDHEDRYENGTGFMADNGEDAAYFANAFRITVYDPAFTTPAWSQNITIYQIMPDRFRNGDPTNDNGWPYPDVYGNNSYLHTTWNQAPCNPRATDGGDGLGPCQQNQWSADFFGGDLQGIIDELDYLQSMGVTAIYLNPVFASPSNHGYDTSNYLQINPRYGNNALFATLATEAQARGIYLILDGVFNHTGSDSTYFDRYNRWDVNGNAVAGNNSSGACEAAASPFAAFFNLYGTGGPCYGGRTYDSWWGYDTLPNLTDYVMGNAVRDYIFDVDNDDDNGVSGTSVIQYWYNQGADGWRFDVADEIPHDWWVQFRNQVKTNDTLTGPLYSEVWFEATPWLYGDQMDATMNYRYRKAVLGFLIDTTWTDNDNNSDQTMWQLSPSQFDYVLGSIREDYPPVAWYTMMNLMGSHDTQRPLFVLRERSTDLNSALAKMALMAALQFTYPGAPTFFYGDEVGLGAVDYGGYSQWGAGQPVNGIIQDDPYSRATYPWLRDDYVTFPSVSGSLPAGLPNNSLLTTYQILGQTRANYDVLRTGDVITLLTDDVNNVYAYARTDAAAPACAIAIFNRSTTPKNVTLHLGAVAAACPDGLVLENVLNNGTDWAISGTTLTVNNIPGLSSAVLVPPFDNPETSDSIPSLPPTQVNLSGASNHIAPNSATLISATVYDIAGQTVPAGLTVNFALVTGGGSLNSATALTNSSGVASVTYNAPATEDEAVIQAHLTAPDGAVRSQSVTVWVDYNSGTANLIRQTTREMGIGPDVAVLPLASGHGITVTKLGNGEPIISLAEFTASPQSTFSIVRSHFYDVHLSNTSNVNQLVIEMTYADETGTEANNRLWWWNGTAWLQVSGATVDTANNRVTFTITTGSVPSLTQLTGTPLVISNYTPSAIALTGMTAAATPFIWPLALLLLLGSFTLIALLRLAKTATRR